VEIEKFWAAKFGAGVRDFRLDRINLRADGNRVYQTAVWSASVSTAGRSHAIDGEMTSVIERQSDGTWQIRLQNWY
jgi:ketosteroid isomerase-like protein